MKNRITGRSAFLALLKDEGITHLFGNPGTTELPVMDALKDHPDMNYVLGRTAGNALEVRESLDVLEGCGPDDVREVTLCLVAEMAALSRGLCGPDDELLDQCARNLDEGMAMDFFVRMIEAQGGDLAAFDRLAPAPVIMDVLSDRSGFWTGAGALETGRAVRELGGGRFRMEDRISPMVGWEQVAPACTEVTRGEILGRIHADTVTAGEAAAARISAGFVWDSQRKSLIYGVL